MNELVKVDDTYIALVDDIRAIAIERDYRVREEIITGKWEIGERIVNDENYKKQRGSPSFIKQLFADARIGKSDGYYCVQWYEKEKLVQKIDQPKLSNALDKYGKNMSWRKIIQTLPSKRLQVEQPTDDQIANYQHKIINGDCLTELPKIDAKSVDMIYIDPPYNVDKADWDTYEDEDFKTFTLQYLKEVFRVLKDKSHFYIHFPANKACWLENLIRDNFGIEPSSRLIWHYRNLVMGRDAKGKYLSTYQPILHYCIGGKELNFDTEWNDERFDVATVATPQTNFKEGKQHITQKPLELLEWLVRTGSNVGDTVLDFFAGSGTTGIASAKLSRDFILIEREEEYVNVIYKRLSELG